VTVSRTSHAVAVTRAGFVRPRSPHGDPRAVAGQAGLPARAGWPTSAADAADLGVGAGAGRSLPVTAGPAG